MEDDGARRQEEVEALQSIFGEACVTAHATRGGVSVVEVRPEVDCPWFVRAFLPANYPSAAPATIEVDGATLPPGAYSDLVRDETWQPGGSGWEWALHRLPARCLRPRMCTARARLPPTHTHTLPLLVSPGAHPGGRRG